VARISGLEAPKFDDNEATFEELKARIAEDAGLAGDVPGRKLDGTEDKDITFPVGREATRTMKGEAYLKHWVLPNFFFHVTTAYAILRHNGVELGKSDYLAARGALMGAGAGGSRRQGRARREPLSRRAFQRGQAVQFGADVGHAAGDDHAAGRAGRMLGSTTRTTRSGGRQGRAGRPATLGPGPRPCAHGCRCDAKPAPRHECLPAPSADAPGAAGKRTGMLIIETHVTLLGQDWKHRRDW
jgi:hypothetical protein